MNTHLKESIIILIIGILSIVLSSVFIDTITGFKALKHTLSNLALFIFIIACIGSTVQAGMYFFNFK